MKPMNTFAVAAIALGFAACSTSSSTTPAPAPAPAPTAGAPSAGAPGNTAGDTIIATEILVNVINSRTPPANVTVFVLGPSIGRIILGDVPINQQKAFTFRAGNLNGDYYLVAQAPGGAEMRSQKFNLTPTLRFVQWNMDVNSIVQYATPK